MVVTCYSRTCSRPELPISPAERKCVRAYARVHERAHAYRCNDTVHERTTQEQEGTYTSVECERICRLLWCLRLLLQWRWKRRQRRRRVRKKKNATTKSATRNVTISSLFFYMVSLFLSFSFSFLQCSLSYSLISFLLRCFYGWARSIENYYALYLEYVLFPRLPPQTTLAYFFFRTFAT